MSRFWLILILSIFSCQQENLISSRQLSKVSVSPNIIIIQVDNMTVDEIQYMPYLSSLLRTEFTNIWTASPLCCPGRASLLTGQLVHNHGVFTNSPPFGFAALNPNDVFTLALQQEGYKTCHIGKYLNGYVNPGVPIGWNEWYTYIYDGGGFYYDYRLSENGTLISYGSTPQDYSTDVFFEKAATFIQNTTSPYYIQVDLHAVHQANPALRHTGLYSGVSLPMPESFNEDDVSDKPLWIRQTPKLTQGEINSLEQYYRRRIESLLAVDEGIAMLDSISGPNTIFLFMSDSGEMFGEHRVTGLSYPYQESLQIPLFVWGDGIVSQEIDHIAENIDIAPTVLEFAQGSFVRDGISLVPLINGSTQTFRTFVLHELFLPIGGGNNNRYYAGRDDTGSLIAHIQGRGVEFYTPNDSLELESLHENPSLFQSLKFKILLSRECSGQGCVR